MTEESGKLDFLEETAPAPEPEVQETAPEPEQVEATGEEQVTPPVATEEKPQSIPITALLDEREKRQEAMRRAEMAERRAQELERRIAAAQQPQKRPDWFEKPDEAIQYHTAPLEQRILSDKLDISETMAEDKYGAEAVAAAKAAYLQAIQEDPALHQRTLKSKHPYDEVVKWHKRQSFLSQIGDDPETWLDQQIKARMEAQVSQPSPAQGNRPPPSLSKAPAAGRSDPMKPGSAFDQLPIR